MDKLRIMSVFGTRPEAIKMCPLVKELASRPEIESLCCVTAQHRQMLDSVLEVFDLKPDWDLDIMTPRQTLSTITSKCLLGMDEAIDALKPDMILVHGDTSTTFAGALSAFYHQVSVGHVEAGLRTYDKYSPGGDEPQAGLRHRGPVFLPHGEQPGEPGERGHCKRTVYYRKYRHRCFEDNGTKGLYLYNGGTEPPAL